MWIQGVRIAILNARGKSSITKMTPATRNRGREAMAQTCPQAGKSPTSRQFITPRPSPSRAASAKRKHDEPGRDDPHLPRRERQPRQRDDHDQTRDGVEDEARRDGIDPRDRGVNQERARVSQRLLQMALQRRVKLKRQVARGVEHHETGAERRRMHHHRQRRRQHQNGGHRFQPPPRGTPPACARSASRFPSGSAPPARGGTPPRDPRPPDADGEAAASRLLRRCRDGRSWCGPAPLLRA
jgi:hypothetical protein